MDDIETELKIALNHLLLKHEVISPQFHDNAHDRLIAGLTKRQRDGTL